MNSENTIGYSIIEQDFSLETSYIYIIPARFIEQFQIDKKKQLSDLTTLLHNIPPNLSSLTFLLHEKNITEIPRDFIDIGYVGIGNQHDYYSSFFNVLRRILPHTNIDKLSSEFMKNRELTPDNTENNLAHTWSPSKSEEKRNIPF